MLVCNVSLRPSRAGIAADIVEAVDATDATASGQVVFATLVDDPASVSETVDAYLGEIMVEAVSAYADADAGFAYAAAIAEAATAADTPDATFIYTIAEAATAADTPDATTTAGVSYATLDPATATNVALSGGNLTATHSNTTNNSGARSTAVKTTGKFYFEVTFNTTPVNGDCAGIMQNAAPYSDPVSAGTNCSCAYGTGLTYSNDVNTPVALGNFVAGSVLSVAVDLGNARCWFRRGANNWNESSADPAANTGGLTIETPGVGYVPVIGFTSGGSGKNVTVNFGASAFTQAVPSGFTSGWTV